MDFAQLTQKVSELVVGTSYGDFNAEVPAKFDFLGRMVGFGNIGRKQNYVFRTKIEGGRNVDIHLRCQPFLGGGGVVVSFSILER